MELNIKSNERNISVVRLPTSDLSMDSGIRLQAELLNRGNLILDRQYLEISLENLPKLIVDGVQISLKDYLKQKFLEQLNLEENTDPTTLEPVPGLPNWKGLLEAIRGSAVFAKVFALSDSSGEILKAYTTLSVATNSTYPKLEDLYFGLQYLQSVMGDQLATEDVDFINSILAQNNFDFALSYATPTTSTTTA